MRIYVAIGFLLCSFQALAADVVLIPEHTPTPEYPERLMDMRYSGKVRVHLAVAAHGGIQAARIIESSHPAFTEATQRAVAGWRFQPWATNNGEPTKQEIIVPILFGARGIEPFSPEITVGLRNVLCAYLLYEVKASLGNFSDEPLKNVDVFQYTHEFMTGAYVASLKPDPELRAAMLAQMESAIPRIVKHCKRNPDHPVAYYLPKGIREVLVGL